MGTDLKDLTRCPVCGRPVGLLSRNEGYISLGCESCGVSRSVSVEEWNRASSSVTEAFYASGMSDRRKISLPIAHERRRADAQSFP